MDQLFAALFQLFELNHLAFLFAGTMLGLVVGILPGMGGTSGLALVLPFVFTMEPVSYTHLRAHETPEQGGWRGVG